MRKSLIALLASALFLTSASAASADDKTKDVKPAKKVGDANTKNTAKKIDNADSKGKTKAGSVK